MVLASPAVMGDFVYGATCLADIQGNYGTLFCLDAKTGAVRWMTSTFKDSKGRGARLQGFLQLARRSPPTASTWSSARACTMTTAATLVCVDARTGRLHWMAPTPLHIEGSPAIDGDLAVAGAGAIEGDDHKAKGHPGLVLAVKISTGKKLWEYQVAIRKARR